LRPLPAQRYEIATFVRCVVAFDNKELAALATDMRGFYIRKAIGAAALIRPRGKDAGEMNGLLLYVLELAASDSPAIANEAVRLGVASTISDTVI